MPVDVADFETEVIARSYVKPVLVDFWAPWCGPCRMIGPVLEKLAEEQAETWELAKVNTDEQTEVARRYSIMSIPAVKLFSHGQVVDEFVGALPEPRVRDWLRTALPSEVQPMIEQARAMLTDNPQQAVQLLNAALQAEPDNPAANALIAQAIVFEDPQQAMVMLKGVDLKDPEPVRIADAVGVLAHLASRRADPASLPEGPAREAYLNAAAKITERDFEGAFTDLLTVIKTDRRLDDDGARKAMLALFTLIGADNPLTPKYRRKLEMLLF